MNNQPLISVLIPTYNRAEYILKAIDSVYRQNYDNIEVIVVDDGSTDNTQEIIQEYVKKHSILSLQYYYKENGGISSARNFCLEKARGEYIAWVDSDDYWVDGKLHAQMKYFEEHPDCEIVFTKFENEISNEELKKDSRTQHEIEYAKMFEYCVPTALMKREVFEKCGNFSTKLVAGEDTDFTLNMELFEVKNHCLDIVFYRRLWHGNNITMQCSNTLKANINKYIFEERDRKRMLNALRKNVQQTLKK